MLDDCAWKVEIAANEEVQELVFVSRMDEKAQRHLEKQDCGEVEFVCSVFGDVENFHCRTYLQRVDLGSKSCLFLDCQAHEVL